MQTTLSQRLSGQIGVAGARVGVAAPVQRQMVVSRAMSDKLLKKPELKRPELPQRPEQPQQAAAPTAAAPAAPAAPAAAAAAPSSSGGVTIEWQRQRAKEMRQFFQDRKLEAQVKKSQVFGWTEANEIGNGRWVMFGVFVGLLTEYATGVDFPNQIRLMLSYLGIVDLE